MSNVVIVGAGKVGTAVAVLLQESGYRICGISSRNSDTIEQISTRLGVTGTTSPEEITSEADVIFITTPDREIEKVCSDIMAAGGFKKGQVVIHMSGALPARILESVKDIGAFTLSVHPLQAFADVDQAIRNLPGSFFSIEGDDEAIPIGIQIVKSLKGSYFELESSLKPLYHAGAAIASNFMVAILHWSIRTYQQLGMSEEQATKAIWPLITGTLNNVSALGPTKALTGPIARGDIDTVNKHLDILDENQSQNIELYKSLAAYTAKIAYEKGTIDENILEEYKKLFI